MKFRRPVQWLAKFFLPSSRRVTWVPNTRRLNKMVWSCKNPSFSFHLSGWAEVTHSGGFKENVNPVNLSITEDLTLKKKIHKVKLLKCHTCFNFLKLLSPWFSGIYPALVCLLHVLLIHMGYAMYVTAQCGDKPLVDHAFNYLLAHLQQIQTSPTECQTLLHGGCITQDWT